ncbi:myelin protein zero-like protein 2 precursor [Silurus meridionalis]|nr:myelin protein zero-like protein 2 precursor [Silurus meridionalis]
MNHCFVFSVRGGSPAAVTRATSYAFYSHSREVVGSHVTDSEAKTQQLERDRGVYHIWAIEVFTPKELTAVNGTEVRLKCTFTSSEAVSEKTLSISWSFKPLGPGREEQFFYYQEKPYPPTQGQFEGRAAWSGNILKNDASITLNDVQFNFNGTYTCLVRNPPDVHGFTGEIRLEVVQSVKLSEMEILAVAVGGGIALVLIILTIVLSVRYFRGRQGDAGIELQDAKRASVW